MDRLAKNDSTQFVLSCFINVSNLHLRVKESEKFSHQSVKEFVKKDIVPEDGDLYPSHTIFPLKYGLVCG